MSDVMLFGVLNMPFDLAMANELSRYQYHQRGVEAAAEITRLRDQLAEARESAEAAWEQWDELQDLLGASKEVGFAFDEVVQLRKQLAEAERQRDAARAEALAFAMTTLETAHRDHITSLGRDPDKYVSKFRNGVDAIRALIKEDRT